MTKNQKVLADSGGTYMSKYGICMRCLAYRVRCWAYSDKLLILIIHSFIH